MSELMRNRVLINKTLLLIFLFSIAAIGYQSFGGSLLSKSKYQYYLFSESGVFLPPIHGEVYGKLIPTSWVVMDVGGRKTKIHKGPYDLLMSFSFAEEVEGGVELFYVEISNERINKPMRFQSFELKHISYNKWFKDYRVAFLIKNIDLPYENSEISGSIRVHAKHSKEVDFRLKLNTDYQEGESVDFLSNIRGV